MKTHQKNILLIFLIVFIIIMTGNVVWSFINLSQYKAISNVNAVRIGNTLCNIPLKIKYTKENLEGEKAACHTKEGFYFFTYDKASKRLLLNADRTFGISGVVRVRYEIADPEQRNMILQLLTESSHSTSSTNND